MNNKWNFSDNNIFVLKLENATIPWHCFWDLVKFIKPTFNVENEEPEGC